MKKKILESWQLNAENWIHTIDNNEIASRGLATNQAIETVIFKYAPSSMLDLGCGEGWLARSLNARGIPTIGVDGVQSLIDNAREKGGGQYQLCSYEQIIKGEPVKGEPFNGIVINFGLFLNEEVGQLLGSLKDKLAPKGKIFIQTLHPYALAEAGGAYESRWESNSWAGLNSRFTQPHQWYNRTLEDWMSLFSATGLSVILIKEPLNPKTKKPASIIFILESHKLAIN